ncbi:hypothetical protein NAEGRDRAFT_56956 [Naegleria gruberi]|uniref:BTB domain-containing protein n=1 Tax=Naegleria gruberi TaxID=5762 RepID=D2V2W0_NAEGR|nr:uncharacterized protein NAEGRDRAFT_56956 [Naegleria gruberi]EFC48964.1 hypothetical protein NAEGRDRAFT_56956 [Naegleria gruberi]|eukprot:XP_002681708.1 hypothetical protein NAEGRDRAFT_56956 [Naegleria gruberi strain NEG-M]
MNLDLCILACSSTDKTQQLKMSALQPSVEPIRFIGQKSESGNTPTINVPFKSIVSHAMASTIVDPFSNKNEDIPFSLFLFGGQINNKRSDGMFECRIEKMVAYDEKEVQDLLLETKVANNSMLTITEFITCEKRDGCWPSARSHHQMVYRPPNDEHIDGSLVLFGGQDSQFKALGDLYEFDIHTREWKQIVEQSGQLWPTRRHGHSMIYRPSKDSLVILGGVDTLNRTIFEPFEYLFPEKKWKKIELIAKTGSALSLTSTSSIDPLCLRPRANHSAVLYNAQNSRFVQFHTLNNAETVEDGTQDVMIIFGGNNEQDYYNDMFSINLGTLNVDIIMSSHRINVYPRMKHTCIITRGEKALVIGGNRKARYDEMKVVSGKTSKSFFMSVLGSIAPKSSIDAPILNGMVARNLITDFTVKNQEAELDFNDISHHTTCSVSPSCFIFVGGQFNNVGEKMTTNTKNDKIWVCNLGQYSETIEKLQNAEQKKEFGKEFYRRMLDNLGEYGPIGYDLRVNVLNEKTFLVHKFMLSRFEYFRKLIKEHSSHQVGGIVEIPISDASVDTISNVIDYIYGIEPPVFSNPEEVQILTKYCEKHSMGSIVKYTHGKVYLQRSDYESYLPEIQLLLFFKRVYMGEFPELHQYFNSTVRLITQGENAENTNIDIQLPLQILVNNDFFHGCLRDLYIKHKLHGQDSQNYIIEIDNSIFPFLDTSYFPIIERYIATLYQAPVHIFSSEGEAVVSQLIQLYLVSNLLSDTYMEVLIMDSIKRRISFENAFQLLCFAYQHQSPNEVVFIYNECIRKLKEVIPLEDVNKIINFLNQEYAKQFDI